MVEIVRSTEVLAVALGELTNAISTYVRGNKEEVEEIENALQSVNAQLIEKLTDKPPSEVLDYIEKHVDIKLKVEELKVKKGTSLPNILRKWAPVIIPLLVGILPFIGVMVGVSMHAKSGLAGIEANEKSYERELILNAFGEETRQETVNELKLLEKAGLFVHFSDEVSELASELTKPVSSDVQQKKN